MGTMFRNEAQFMREWIEYHRLLGFDHFYLYDNDSTDDYQSVLKPYLESGLVEVISWHRAFAPWEDPGPWIHYYGYQLSAFNDCVRRAQGEATWLAMMDIDEFLVPREGIKSWLQMLYNAAQTDIGSLVFFWKYFGTSGVWDIPPGELVTEKLRLRTWQGLSTEAVGKSIHRPETVSRCSVHDAYHHAGYRNAIIWDTQINHYQLRGRKEALVKRFGETVEHLDHASPAARRWLEEREAMFNLLEDTTIEPYLPALKAALAR